MGAGLAAGPVSGARRRTLVPDVVAGTTVALVLIPQALAYAQVAGMPPVVGLYTAALPPLIAGLLASSPYLQTGPVAVTSLLTFGALAGRAPVGSPEYVELGVMLALIVGLVRVAIGLMRAGVVAHLMSEPVMIGFLTASALLIVASQLPGALGAPGDGGVVSAAVEAVAHPGTWSWEAIGLATATLVLVLGARRLPRSMPVVLVALVAGVAVASLLPYGGEVVGPIPGGLPDVPSLRLDAVPELLVPGVVIALVGFGEAASVARTYAIRERQRWSADREFLSQGAASLASCLSGGYPAGGSISRSALNYESGARTRLSGAVTGIVVICFLPFAAVLDRLPVAILAAIVIGAVLGLIRLRPLVALWRLSRPQWLVAWTTLVLTIVLAPHVERALLAGIALSIGIHLARELGLRVDSRVEGDVLCVRPAGILWFATAEALYERMLELLEGQSQIRTLRLDLGGLGRIDLTGALTIGRMLDDLAASGIEIEVTDVPRQSQELLRRSGVIGGHPTVG
jgi:sulfate permease, SulP family